MLLAFIVAIAPAPLAGPSATARAATQNADQFQIVDGLVPARIKKLGTHVMFVGARQAVRISATDLKTLGIEPGGDNGVYREGDHLLISVTAPDFDGYLYLDYFDAAGKYVVHLLPNDMRPDNRVRAGQRVVIGTLPREEMIYTVSPPFGSNRLMAIASSEPLFDRPRPHLEPAVDDYVAALRSSLERARQGGSSNLAAGSADLVFKPRD